LLTKRRRGERFAPRALDTALVDVAAPELGVQGLRGQMDECASGLAAKVEHASPRPRPVTGSIRADQSNVVVADLVLVVGVTPTCTLRATGGSGRIGVAGAA
jgi:hypothetical protein